MERIANRGLLRSFSDVYQLTGEGPSGPPGLQLATGGVATADVDQLARYNAARTINPRLDGWFLVSAAVTHNAIGFNTASFDPVALAVAIGAAQPDDVFWIYDSSAVIEASADLADFDELVAWVQWPDGDGDVLGPGAILDMPFYQLYSSSTSLSHTSATKAFGRKNPTNGAVPFPVPSVCDVQMSLRMDAAVGTITATMVLAGRFLPLGVPPW